MNKLNLTVGMLKEAFNDFDLSDDTEIQLSYKEGNQVLILIPQEILVKDDFSVMTLLVDHKPIPLLSR